MYYGRITVRVTGTLLLLPPEDAVTVTDDVPACVPVVAAPLEFTAGGGESLLPYIVDLPEPLLKAIEEGKKLLH